MSSPSSILPPARLGILGGGQLGRFFVIAAREMGYHVTVLDPDTHSPAGAMADTHLAAAYTDPAALDELGRTCAAITTEFENVPADSLQYLAKFCPVAPSADCVRVAQDRIHEKQTLEQLGFTVAPFHIVDSAADIAQAPVGLFPGILKRSRFGYDGKGQTVVQNVQDAAAAYAAMGSEPCVLEKKLPLDSELSVVLARSASGEIRCFPPVENRHRHGILDVSIAPASLSKKMTAAAEKMACGVAEKLDYVGVLAVEFFISKGALTINEIAPRPHNSGHYTLDACITNQFEQQVRALCGLPLGDPRLHTPAVMVNLLGDIWYSTGKDKQHEPAWNTLLDTPNARLHLYGKHHARHGRKMGHFTVLDPDRDHALKTALALRSVLNIHD